MVCPGKCRSCPSQWLAPSALPWVPSKAPLALIVFGQWQQLMALSIRQSSEAKGEHSSPPRQYPHRGPTDMCRWHHKCSRIQRSSPHGRRPGWAVRPVIVKSGDDCRQELLAVQLIKAFHDVFQVGAGARLTAPHCKRMCSLNSLALPPCFAGPDCTAKVEVLADGQVGMAGLLLELRDLIQVNVQLSEACSPRRRVPCPASKAEPLTRVVWSCRAVR